MLKRMEEFLKERIQPTLAAHGGFIRLVDIDNNIVFIELSGGCQGCAAAKQTLSLGVERMIKEEFPSIEKVVDLTNHDQGDNPYFKKEDGESPFK